MNFYLKKIVNDCACNIKLICVMYLLITAQKRWVGKKLQWDKEMITDCKVVYPLISSLWPSLKPYLSDSKLFQNAPR